MSLDQATISQLSEHFKKTVEVKLDELLEKETHLRKAHLEQMRLNAELLDQIEKQKETISTLELANATMRRRLESLEGVTS